MLELPDLASDELRWEDGRKGVCIATTPRLQDKGGTKSVEANEVERVEGNEERSTYL